MQVNFYYRISQESRRPTDNKACRKSVKQADEAARESYRITDKIMAEKRKSRSDALAAFQQKKICRHKDQPAADNSDGDAKRRRINSGNRLNYQLIFSRQSRRNLAGWRARRLFHKI